MEAKYFTEKMSNNEEKTVDAYDFAAKSVGTAAATATTVVAGTSILDGWTIQAKPTTFGPAMRIYFGLQLIWFVLSFFYFYT